MKPYMAGGRNLMDLADVSRGEEVLLLVTQDTDAGVAELISHCAGERGAVVTRLFQYRGKGHEKLSPVLAKAMQGAGAVFDRGEPFVLHSAEGVVALLDYGMKYLVVPPTLEKFDSPAARFPVGLWFEISKRVQEIIRRNPEIRLTCPRGTDFRMRISDPGDVGGFIGPVPFEAGHAVPGYIGIFPPGAVVWGDMAYSGNGTILVDGWYDYGRVDPPLAFEIKDGWVSEVSGNREVAEDVRRRMRGVKNAGRFAELIVGTNPKVEIDLPPANSPGVIGRVLSSTRRAGTVKFGIGGNTLLGGSDFSFLAMYGINLHPELHTGGHVLIKDGRLSLLDEPEMREITAEYGDPAELLSAAGEATGGG